MGLFKKIKNTLNKASGATQDLFKKGMVGNTKLFGKDSMGSHVLRDASKGLNAVSGVARQVGREVGNIANNPLINAVVGSNPYGAEILAGARGLSSGLGGVSELAKQGSALTKQKNYSGGPEKVAQNIVERAKGMVDAASNINFV